MKTWQLKQIARMRAQVQLLRREPHIASCLCCQSDCDALEDAADSPHAEVFLIRLVRKCHEAGVRATRRT
jgi:hypothetical protein